MKIEIHTEGTKFGKKSPLYVDKRHPRDRGMTNVAVKISLKDTNFNRNVDSCTEARLFESEQNSQ